MIRLDVGILAFASAIAALTSAVMIAMFDATRQRPSRLRAFAVSGLLYGVGLIISLLYHRLWYHLIVVQSGNFLVVTSAMMFHLGVVRLLDRPAPLPLYVVCGMVFIGAFNQFTDPHGDQMARVVIVSLARVPLFAHAAMMMRAERRAHPSVRPGLEAICWGWVGLLVGRCLASPLSSPPDQDFLGMTGVQAWYFAGSCLGFIGVNVALFHGDFERTEVALRERIAEKTASLREAKEAAEAALLAKSRFLAAASHDLRQPVHALRLLLAVMDGRTAAAVRAPEHADLVGEAVATGDRLALLLESLLDLSRLDAGVVAPTLIECPLDAVLADQEHQFRRLAERADVQLRVVRTSLVARTDPALLARVMSNLIANAIRFAPEGAVVIGCRRRGAEIDIDVCDNGVGIPADMTTLIFDEFTQLGNPARQTEGGLGLGLAIVRHIAPLLGARVQVRSIVGRGSVFSIRLPRAAPTTGARPNKDFHNHEARERPGAQ